MTNSYKIARQIAAAAVLSISTINAMAQSDAATLIRAGTSDANTLMDAYASPLMKSFGAGLNGGWFQTAKVHGIGGFDVTFALNATFAPSGDKSFDVNSLNLQKARLAAGESSTSPTFFGSDKNGPKMEVHDKSPITGNDTAIASFKLPPGIGFTIGGMPTAQLAVGVGFGTEVALRFMPTLNAGFGGAKYEIGLIGFGVKHDIKQWIPGVKALPFDMSAMFGYTSMHADVGLEGDNAIKADTDPGIYNPNPGKTYDNQKMEFKSKAWTLNLLVSKQLGPFTPYLGLGYQHAKTDLTLVGDFPVTVPNDVSSATNPTDPSFGYPARIQEIKDPISVSGTLSGVRATAGFRLKLAVITFHGDYTFGQYNVASAGIGINLQSIVPFKL